MGQSFRNASHLEPGMSGIPFPTPQLRRPPSRQLLLCERGASDFAFTDFASTAGLRLVGVSNRTGDRLRLTSALPGVAGAAWHSVKQVNEGAAKGAVKSR